MTIFPLDTFSPEARSLRLLHGFNNLDDLFSDEDFSSATKHNGSNYPSIDIYENDQEFIFKLDVPGFNKQDFKISVVDQELKISGERAKESVENKDKLIHQGRNEINFSKCYSLHKEVISSDCLANYKDGVLEIKLKKLAQSAPKFIDVN
ncbi:MAG: Hsp20/alpha crystallin family protein [SAR324 cluster bacterium]|nr:Hsp20/alpha crystallin family protein [SAR324 cluster bacterium]